MKVPDVRRNLVPGTWTADGEGVLPELGPCRHDNSCVGCRGTEMATFTAPVHLMDTIRYDTLFVLKN